MVKYLISAFLFLSIVSCTSEDIQAIDDLVEVIELFEGNDEEDGVDDGVNIQGDDSNTDGISANGNEILNVVGFGETVTINSEKKTDLFVAGSNNTVNIETNIGELTVAGSNNFLTFSPNTSVDFCTVAGSDNSVQKDESVIISCEITGSGNMGF